MSYPTDALLDFVEDLKGEFKSKVGVEIKDPVQFETRVISFTTGPECRAAILSHFSGMKVLILKLDPKFQKELWELSLAEWGLQPKIAEEEDEDTPVSP